MPRENETRGEGGEKAPQGVWDKNRAHRSAGVMEIKKLN